MRINKRVAGSVFGVLLGLAFVASPLAAFAATTVDNPAIGPMTSDGSFTHLTAGTSESAGTYVVYQYNTITASNDVYVTLSVPSAEAADSWSAYLANGSGATSSTETVTGDGSGSVSFPAFSLSSDSQFVYLTDNSESYGAPALSDVAVSYGSAPSQASVPSGLSAVPGDASASLSWSAGSGDVSYNVYENGTLLKSGLTSTSYTATGLQNGTQYSFTVSAVDSNGVESAQSTAVTVTPKSNTSTADVPTGLTAAAADGSVSLSWTGDTTDVSYDVYQDGSQVASGLTVPSYTATGLTDGTSYSFTVSAVDSTGLESAQSAAVSATPSTAPVAVNSVSVNPGSTTAMVTWNGNQGPFTVTWSDASGQVGSTTVASGSSYDVSGLIQSTNYSVTVTDANGASASDAFATVAGLSPASMPDSSSVFQKLVDMFGAAGKYALDVIGAAVALGIIVIVAMYVWRLLKRWLQKAK